MTQTACLANKSPSRHRLSVASISLFFHGEFNKHLTTRNREIWTMRNNNQVNESGGMASHFVAATAGFVLMMVGVGLSVTMVLLPIGIPLGLAGLGLLTWGLTPGGRK
jgi:hypothetical protein